MLHAPCTMVLSLTIVPVRLRGVTCSNCRGIALPEGLHRGGRVTRFQDQREHRGLGLRRASGWCCVAMGKQQTHKASERREIALLQASVQLQLDTALWSARVFARLLSCANTRLMLGESAATLHSCRHKLQAQAA